MHVPQPYNVLIITCFRTDLNTSAATMAPSSSAQMPRYMSSTFASRAKQKPAVRPSSEVSDVELPRATRVAGLLPPASPFALSSSPFQSCIATSPCPHSEIDAASATFDDEAELQLQQEMGSALRSSPPRLNEAEEEAPAANDDEGVALPEAASGPAPTKKKCKHGTKKTKAQKIVGCNARRDQARDAASKPDPDRRSTRGAVKRRLASSPSSLPPLKKSARGRPVESRYALRRQY